MRYEKTRQARHRIRFILERDFNLLTVQHIEQLLRDETEVDIDLAASHFVDSEALVLIDRLQREGRQVKLFNPPRIFYEAVHILGLEQAWNLDKLVDRSSHRN